MRKLNYKQSLGILFILLGAIFVVFPAFSNQALSAIAGISLMAFGLSVIIDGVYLMDITRNISIIKIVIGICAICLGLLFVYKVNELYFLISYQSYLIGILLLVIGIIGIFVKSSYLKISSLVILIVGGLFIYLGYFALINPVFVSVLVGITLIMEGIIIFKSDPKFEYSDSEN